MESTEARLARLEERTSHIRTAVDDIRVDQKSQNAQLTVLLEMHQQRKGAQKFAKALLGIGSGSGAVALIAWIAEHFHP